MTSSPRSLVPVPPSLPAQRPSRAMVATTQWLPPVQRVVTATVVGFAVEYALRAVTNRALASLLRPAKRTTPVVTRTVITEVVVIQRMRRP